MPIGPGSHVGPYEITALIGEGGMGRVYRATDTNLKRTVAIKVLPEAFAEDADRLARFDREARTLAALNHPNIAAIYGLERSEGSTFLIMECVEGPTLADRIANGRIPLDEALPIARHITEALEAAHEQGIIHRDLKPANIKVRDDGTVKVLDFGLAKPLVSEPSIGSPGRLANSPTLTAPAVMTGVGVLLGTAAYMPPEQARGKGVDRRADIWAFGCVLYEMLTGKQAFPGEDVPDTLGAVLRGEPDWRALPADTPLPVRRLVQRCLQKDRGRRWQHIGDARIEIGEAIEEPAPPAVAKARSTTRYALWGLAAVLAAAVGSAAMVMMRDEPVVARRIRFDIGPPEGMQLATPPGRIAVSPDGTAIAFAVTGQVPGRVQLFLRELGSEEARAVPGKGIVGIPFWSPDGRFLAFLADGKLKSVQLANGVVQQICDLGMPSNLVVDPFVGNRVTGASGTWNRAGTIVFSVGVWAMGEAMPPALGAVTLFRVTASGGQATPATTLGEDEIEHAFPHFLPDGQHFLYRARLRSGEARTYVQSLTTSTRMQVLSGVANVQYAQPGYLLYAREQTLYAQPFDHERLAATGEPRAIANGVETGRSGRAVYSGSDGGVLAYAAAWTALSGFTIVDRSGDGTTIGEPARYLNSFDLSPDGSRLVVAQQAKDGAPDVDLWVLNLQTGVRSRETFDRGNGDPVWSHDGSRIAYTAIREGRHPALFVKEFGSSREAEALLDGVDAFWAEDWSSNGRYLAFVAGRSGTSSGMQIGVLPLADPERKPTIVVSSPFQKDEPHFSPDSRWIAFNSSESGTSQVYVTAFPPDGRQWQVSPGGGMQARWRGDGRELYYLAPDGMLMAVPMDPATGQPTGRPEPLFQTKLQPVANQDQYEVSRDGQRFYLLLPRTSPGAPGLAVVVNWLARLP